MLSAALSVFVQVDSDRLQRLCEALDTYLRHSGRWDEQMALSQQAEGRALSAGDFWEAGLRAYSLGWIFYLRGQVPETLACAARCIAHFEKSHKNKALGTAYASGLRGNGHLLEKNYPQAIEAFKAKLDLLRALYGANGQLANAWNDLAATKSEMGDLDGAEIDFREALRLAETHNEPDSFAIIIGNLADLELERKKWQTAEALAQQALLLAEAVGRQESVAHQCYRLARAFAGQGKPQDGLPYAQRALEIFTRLRRPANVEEARAALKACGG